MFTAEAITETIEIEEPVIVDLPVVVDVKGLIDVAMDEPEDTMVDVLSTIKPITDVDPTMEKRSLAECWVIYRSSMGSHTQLTNDEIILMMQSCVDAITLLEQIDPSYFALAVDAIRHPSGYFDLLMVARARCIEDADMPKLPGVW